MELTLRPQLKYTLILNLSLPDYLNHYYSWKVPIALIELHCEPFVTTFPLFHSTKKLKAFINDVKERSRKM